jgi:hypothetical protein
MSKIEVNQISSQCGSTLTIGQSGDTVTLACGATQTGFGRTGTVDWDTTAKTASFTAVSGNGYFVNTTSGAITMTLPASPSSGDIISFKDYANTFDTNNLTIARNGSFITGGTTNAIISVEGQSGTLIYVDGTKGWLIVNAATDSDLPAPAFITATGGTVTCCGDYKVHTFTSPGTFTVTCAGNPSGSSAVDYLVVAGGGGGSGTNSGGAGAGGFRESHSTPVSGCYTASPLATPTGITVTAQGYPIVVGGGGAGGGQPNGGGAKGSDSSGLGITSTGGGYAIGDDITTPSPGGSGGGGGGNSGNGIPSGQTGNTPSVSPPQGNPGGNLDNPCGGAVYTGGGGGAGGAGPNGGGSITNPKGADGIGTQINPAVGTPGPDGSLKYFSGGGTGAWIRVASPRSAGSPTYPGPDSGGGGVGAGGICGANGGNGTANSGGGGGGSRCSTGGTGGSGIVIIRYKFQ